jgi:Spy/CpxP family protein refolding chaperone
MRLKTSLVAAGLALLLPLAASAEMEGPHAAFHHGAGQFGFLKGVTLTDAQKTQIHALQKASWTAAKPTMQQLHALRKEISDKLAGTAAVNESELASLQSQAATLREKLETARLHTAVQVRALLTSSQLAQAAQTHAQLESLHAQEHAVMSRGTVEQ